MRLPGTFNQKRGRWCAAVRADLSRPPVSAEALREALPDPQPRRPPEPARSWNGGQAGEGSDDPLRLVAPPVYFRALAGVEVPSEGAMVRCPLPGHDDGSPSFTVYPGDGGWYCFGCGRGGSIYDLAAGLWDLATNGGDFLELRRRLEEIFLAGGRASAAGA